MSLTAVCQQATCFQNNWQVDLRLTSMIRKFGFLELNKYLKDRDIINRYKRNIELKEAFESSYSKTVSSMIRDLIESVFTGIDMGAINLEKQRGYAAYSFSLRLPAAQGTYERLIRNLEGLRTDGFLSWTTWRLYAGATGLFQINFDNLPVIARHPSHATSDLPTFIQHLNELAVCIREVHPAPVQVDARTTEQPTTTAPAPAVPVTATHTTLPVAPRPERTTPITLRRID
jgi:hypothetical protein